MACGFMFNHDSYNSLPLLPKKAHLSKSGQMSYYHWRDTLESELIYKTQLFITDHLN